MYSGDDTAKGMQALEPFLATGNPKIREDGHGKLFSKTFPYANLNEHLLDSTEGLIPDNILETKRCALVNDPLTQADYQKMIDHFCNAPSPWSLVSMEPYGGAINERDADATAFVHRDAFFDIFTDAFWSPNPQNPEKEAADKAEAFKWLDDMYNSPELAPIWSKHYYQNYPNSDYKNWEEGYFGTNYPRLQEIKAKWDPKNMFSFQQSIRLPAEKK